MPNKYRATNNMISKTTSRRLGILSSIKEFCDKNNLPFRPLKNDDEDPINIVTEAIEQLAFSNEFKQNVDDVFIKKTIHLDKEPIIIGYFTINEINQIGSIDPRLDIQ
jgi:hypothetical protein